MSAAGTFRDAQGQVVHLPPPTSADLEAVAQFRSELNRRLAPEAVLERIRTHTALIAAARQAGNGSRQVANDSRRAANG